MPCRDIFFLMSFRVSITFKFPRKREGGHAPSPLPLDPPMYTTGHSGSHLIRSLSLCGVLKDRQQWAQRDSCYGACSETLHGRITCDMSSNRAYFSASVDIDFIIIIVDKRKQ